MPRAWFGWLIALCLFGCGRRPSTHERVGAASSVSVPTNRGPSLGAATLAKLLSSSAAGVVWAAGARLGALDLSTATNAFVVGTPRGEAVVCAAWSDEGSLLAAVTAQGTHALWGRDGQLLAELPGTQAVQDCSASDFHFSSRARRVLIASSGSNARLLGERVAYVVVGSDPQLLKTGERLLVTLDGGTAVLDAATGHVLGKLAGAESRRRVSADERYVALPRDERHVNVYELSTFELLQTLPGEEPAFHGDKLLLSLAQADPERRAGTAAYSLSPIAKLWQRPAISVFDDAMFGAGEPGPWGVGSSTSGYSVFDLRTGQKLASWRASGYGCGYAWRWQDGTLLFSEGDLLTFWSRERGAATIGASCHSTQLSPDGRWLLSDQGVLDVVTRRKLAHIPALMGAVESFGRDHRHLFGSAMLEESKELERVAWDAVSGRVLWRQPLLQNHESLRVSPSWWRPSEDGRALGRVDEQDGSVLWFAQVVEPHHEVVPLLFDANCWAGPSQLPAASELPAGLPSRHCPEHLASWSAKWTSK